MQNNGNNYRYAVCPPLVAMKRGARLVELLLLVLVLAIAMPAFSDEERGNPWCELSADLRSVFQHAIQTDAALNDPEFRAWYERWHCGDASSGAATECAVDRNTYPEFFYNHRLDLPYRVSVACVMSKLNVEFPELVAKDGLLEHIVGFGQLASFTFSVRNEQEFRRFLEKKDYGDSAGAGLGHEWGYRSPLGGTQLHFKKDKDDAAINVHLDQNSPRRLPPAQIVSVVTDLSPMHLFATAMYLVEIANHMEQDLRSREKYYSPAQIVQSMGPGACGLGETDLAALSIVVQHEAIALSPAPQNCQIDTF